MNTIKDSDYQNDDLTIAYLVGYHKGVDDGIKRAKAEMAADAYFAASEDLGDTDVPEQLTRKTD